MNYVILVIPFLLVGIPFVYGEVEHGKNFDREVISVNPDGSKVIKWTSTNERILYNGEYVDFRYWEDESKVYYESASYSVILDKATNTFEVYDGYSISGNPHMKLTHTPKEAVSGTGVYDEILVNIPRSTTNTVNGKELQIISTQGNFQTVYDLRIGSFEWTYIYYNNDVTKNNHEYGVSFVCDGVTCNDIEIDDTPVTLGQTVSKPDLVGKNIKTGKFNLDLKEEQHGSTWALKHPSQNKMIIDFTDSQILPPGETLIIDPVFSGSSESFNSSIREKDNDDVCEDTGSSTYEEIGTGADQYILVYNTGNTNGDCSRVVIEWDVSSIPDSSTITDSVFKFEAGATSGTPNDIDIYSITTQQPSTRTLTQNFDECNNDTLIVDDTNAFDTTSTNVQVDLTATADTDFTTHINAANDYIAICLKHSDETITATAQQNTPQDGGTPDLTLELTYEEAPAPDAVDDLTSTDVADTTVDLSWTQPSLNTGNLTGYQINYSTPHGDPLTIITNNTGTSDTTTQITGLTELTQYSFRIGVWTESKNMSGNILNVTTLEDFALANFTPGFFDVNATNDDIIQMFFERQDINSTALFLNVTYPNTYDLACDFRYEFANTNTTYRNLDNVTISATAIESSFQFIDVDNEIIDVYCWDESNLNNDGSYLISQTSFPLLEQIANFRTGEYGTDGAFGAIDFITLGVVIISMIGFNRVNESVGAVFNIILLGALAYFEIIELPTIIFGAIAVVLVLVVTSTRKV